MRALFAPEALIARPPLAVDRIVPELAMRRSVEAVDQLIVGLLALASVPPARDRQRVGATDRLGRGIGRASRHDDDLLRGGRRGESADEDDTERKPAYAATKIVH